MKNHFISEILPGILAGIVFIVLLFGFQWNILLTLFLTVGIFVALHLLLRPKRTIGNVDVEDIPQGKELRKLLDEAQADFDAIANLMNQIFDQEVWQQAKKLKQLSEGILRYLEEHPEKIWNARAFIDYYQETASSILKYYVELQKSNLQTEEIKEQMNKTRQSLDTLNLAFEKQFQKLMEKDILDMDAEMQALEEMVKMEK